MCVTGYSDHLLQLFAGRHVRYGNYAVSVQRSFAAGAKIGAVVGSALVIH